MSPNEAREELGMEPVEDTADDAEGEQQPGDAAEGETDPEQEQAQEQAQTPTVGKAEDQPVTPEPNASETEADPGAPDKENKPMPKKGGSGQGEAMNKYYYKGQELGKEAPAPPSHILGPDGKPKPNPFAPKPTGPDGSPLPDASEKSVDKTIDVITSFEKTLRDAIGSAAAGAPDSETPPSEPRPSRRTRRQSKI